MGGKMQVEPRIEMPKIKLEPDLATKTPAAKTASENKHSAPCATAGAPGSNLSGLWRHLLKNRRKWP